MTKDEKWLCDMLFNNRDGHMTMIAGNGAVLSLHRTFDVWPDDTLGILAAKIATEQRRREATCHRKL